ncbi:MAG: aminoacyl-tRNA hydrolase [Spirochaetales bacterium]
MTNISLCVFLGNPGRDYVHTRHNAGFMLAQHHPELRSASWQEKFHGEYASLLYGTRKVHLLRPMTYMNKSGIAAAAAASFFKIDPTDILVVHDELGLAFGSLGVRAGGGLGGHNGLRSVAERLGTNNFARLRIGIGRPKGAGVSGYVLSQFNRDEKAVLPTVLDAAGSMFEGILEGSYKTEVKRTAVDPPR